jgi:hypothetical protein
MNKKILNIALFSAILLGSCKKGWLDVNENPNSPTKTSSDLVFSTAINSSVGGSNGYFQLGAFWGGQWAQSSSFIGGGANLTYNITSTDFNFWTGLYDNLFDIQYVIDNGVKDNVPNFVHYAKVMKAYQMQKVVDLYGDAPYTEGLKGASILIPRYDNAESIYDNLVILCNEAITALGTAPSAVNNQDFLFKGNNAKWRRFANTVKLRLLMRQSRVTTKAAYITTELNKIVADGGVIQLGEDVLSNPGYQNGVLGKINQFYNTFGYTENGAQQANYQAVKINTVLMNYIKSVNDPRLATIAAPNPSAIAPFTSSSYTPVGLGVTAANLIHANTSSIGSNRIVVGNMVDSMPIITSAEAQFLLAEAKYLFPSSTLPGSAEAYYNNGVAESFRINRVPMASAQLTTFLAQPAVNFMATAAANQLTLIMRQKWVALTNYDGLESWSEQRKSNIPTDAQCYSASAARPNAPYRLPYPLVETSANANAPFTGANYIFDAANKLFWDKN